MSINRYIARALNTSASTPTPRYRPVYKHLRYVDSDGDIDTMLT